MTANQFSILKAGSRHVTVRYVSKFLVSFNFFRLVLIQNAVVKYNFIFYKYSFTCTKILVAIGQQFS